MLLFDLCFTLLLIVVYKVTKQIRVLSILVLPSTCLLPAIEEEERYHALAALVNELAIADSSHVIEELSPETFQFLSNNLIPEGKF